MIYMSLFILIDLTQIPQGSFLNYYSSQCSLPTCLLFLPSSRVQICCQSYTLKCTWSLSNALKLSPNSSFLFTVFTAWPLRTLPDFFAITGSCHNSPAACFPGLTHSQKPKCKHFPLRRYLSLPTHPYKLNL